MSIHVQCTYVANNTHYIVCVLYARTSVVYLIKSVLQDLSNGPCFNLTTVLDISFHKFRSFSLLDLNLNVYTVQKQFTGGTCYLQFEVTSICL